MSLNFNSPSRGYLTGNDYNSPGFQTAEQLAASQIKSQPTDFLSSLTQSAGTAFNNILSSFATAAPDMLFQALDIQQKTPLTGQPSLQVDGTLRNPYAFYDPAYPTLVYPQAQTGTVIPGMSNTALVLIGIAGLALVLVIASK